MSSFKSDSRYPITHSDLTALFKSGLSRGDCVLVHASLSALGYIEGGADTVIDALLEVIDESGTLIMPTATTSFSKTGFFDVRHTPSEMGVLSETFRLKEGVRRSPCPMGSFAAIGKYTGRFTRKYNSFLDTDSPLTALLELSGKVLLYGVDYNKCTLYHLSEERQNVPYNDYRHFNGTVVNAQGEYIHDGQTYFVRKSLDTKKDVRPACVPFDEHADVLYRKINSDELRIFPARTFDHFCMTVLDADPGVFLA